MQNIRYCKIIISENLTGESIMDTLQGVAVIYFLLYLFLLVGISSINNQMLRLNNNLEKLILPELRNSAKNLDTLSIIPQYLEQIKHGKNQS
jgi:membrane-anchored glycerophosphoryl diester phosphodiesterase (GDPDase)